MKVYQLSFHLVRIIKWVYKHFPFTHIPNKIKYYKCSIGTLMKKLLGKPRPLDSRNRVTLPSEVIDLLKLKPNDEIFFRLDEGKITIGKALIKYELIDEIFSTKNQ